MSQKRKRSASPQNTLDEDRVFRSSPIDDRDSTFIGLYSPSLQPKQLQSLAEIKSASHKILGWRRESNQQSITKAKQYISGHDDDGEKYGGKKVEQVLVNASVTGCIVVARRYGGTMLGPVRFAHMENCAREALRKWQDHVAEESMKKRKLEEEVQEKARLVKTLAARDQSIVVLRGLALEKEELAKKTASLGSHVNVSQNEPQTSIENVSETGNMNASPRTKATAPPTPAIDYSTIPLERLRSLEKARDATISFLLKRIDKAEKESTSRKETRATNKEPP